MTALFIIVLIVEVVLAFVAIRVENTPLYWAMGYAIPLTVLVYIALRVSHLV